MDYCWLPSCTDGVYKLPIQNRQLKIILPRFLKRAITIYIQKNRQSIFALN